MAEKKVWNEDAETMSRDEMEALRFQKLEKQLRYCYTNSAFYRDAFDGIGLKPEDVKTWEGFRTIPVLMTKEEERGGQAETRETLGHTYGKHLCVPPEKIIVAKTTGGTSGIPTFSHSYTRNDLHRWNECNARALWLDGFRPGDKLLFCFPLTGGYVSSGGLCIDPLIHMGVLTIDVGMEAPLEKIFQFALWTESNGLIASPSFADTMIERCKEMTGKDIKDLGFKRMLLTGEPGIGIPAVRSRIENAFGGRWCDWIAPNGEGFCGSCDLDEFPGLHEVAPEFSICCEDLVDPVTKEPVDVKDGAVGEPVMTSLDREGVPYVKYTLGDVVQVFTKPCDCGYPGPGYRKKILGRVEDVLRVGGVITFPPEIKNTVNAFVPRVTGAFRIVLTEHPPAVTPPLKIKVEHGKALEKKDLEKLGKEMKESFLKNNSIHVSIEFVPPEALASSRFKTPIFEKLYTE
ncbi:MAG: phenylacetate--CoA ligase family protein [Pseudomonadota bacterium]